MKETPPTEQAFSKTVTINAAASKVWAALTTPILMHQWMGDVKLDIETDWQVGSPILIKGDWYKA